MLAKNYHGRREIAVFCDDCGRLGPRGFLYPSYAERRAVEQGWNLKGDASGTIRAHVCPTCAGSRAGAAFRSRTLAHAVAAVIATTLSVTGASAQTLGRGGTMIDERSAVAQCTTPIGTVALVEQKAPATPEAGLPPGMAAFLALARAQQGENIDPIPLLKLLAARSNCFQVVDRGEGFAALQREREIAAAGQAKSGTGAEGPTLQGADYLLTAQTVYADGNAGGHGGALGGLYPGGGGLLGYRSKKLEAQTLLTLVAVKSGVQTAIASGSARKHDLSILSGGLARAGVGGLGGAYTSTDMGKITAAAYLDAWNKLVAALPGDPSGKAELPPASAEPNPAETPR